MKHSFDLQKKRKVGELYTGLSPTNSNIFRKNEKFQQKRG